MKGLVVLAIILFTSASAIGQEVAGPYIGIGIDRFDHETRDLFIRFQDESPSWKIYGGYRFGEHWALEGAYGRANDLNSSVSEFPVAADPLTLDFSVDYEFLQMRGLRYFGNFYVGLGLWKSEQYSVLIATPTSPFGPIRQSESDSGASIVIGGQWDLDRFSIRTEFEHFDTKNFVDVSRVGVSAHFRF